jgi:death on curing protein
MTRKTDYITVLEALAIHSVGLLRHGGTQGIRDLGALESALFRPQSGYYKDLIEEASALLESLTINHPFLDGNKRAAFAITDVFLNINGYEIDITSRKAILKIDELFAENNFDMAHLEPWLRKVIRKKLK